MLTFLLASLLIELTPGPNMTWLAALGVSRGRVAALAAVAGIALGLALAGVVAGAGLSALIASVPWLFTGLRWAGALYLFYLAYDAWRDSAAPIELRENAPILPQFIDSARPIAAQVAVLTLLFISVATAVHATIAVLAGSVASWLADSPHARTVRRFLALVIAAAAVRFLYATRPTP